MKPTHTLLDDWAPELEEGALPPRPNMLWWLTIGLALHGWIGSIPELWLHHSLEEPWQWAVWGSLGAILVPVFWALVQVFKRRWWWALAYLGSGVFLLSHMVVEGHPNVSVIFYYVMPHELTTAVLLLLTITQQQGYSRVPILWLGTRTLTRAYLLTWVLMITLVFVRQEEGEWALWGCFFPLTVGLLITLFQTWAVLGALPYRVRFLWWGFWIALYLVWMAGGCYWWEDGNRLILQTGQWLNKRSPVDDWAFYGDLLRGSGLLLLLFVYGASLYHYSKK